MISMNGNVQHQTSVSYGTETDLLVFGLFVIAYTAVLWYTINKLVDSTRTHGNSPSQSELYEYGR